MMDFAAYGSFSLVEVFADKFLHWYIFAPFCFYFENKVVIACLFRL